MRFCNKSSTIGARATTQDPSTPIVRVDIGALVRVRPIMPTVKLKLWFEDQEEQVFFGEGRAKLFQGIKRHKSISVASKHIGMSYRYALHRISIAEERSGRKLVDRFRGGRTRGGARLTEQGRYILARYLHGKRLLGELATSM